MNKPPDTLSVKTKPPTNASKLSCTSWQGGGFLPPNSSTGRKRIGMDAPPITIDSEFHRLLMPLEPDERSRLEQSVIEQGCRDPLVLWARDGNPILIDGHN